MSESSYVFDVTVPGFEAETRRSLNERGFAVLRGLFAPEDVAAVLDRVRQHTALPAMAGVPGYNKVDHPKRLLSPYAVGGKTVDFILDERVIDLVEAHMVSECVLAEANVKVDEGVGYVYFDLHADFHVGWRKGGSTTFELTSEAIELPIGIGGAIYLEDTTEGAFSYCDGTHTMKAPRGPDFADYPPEERKELLERLVRIDGQAGDFVLFDDRGFHGPDQPSRVQRTVILVDYYRVDTFGRTMVSPQAVWTTDIGRMTPKQLRVMGAGADFMIPPDKYMSTRFRRNPMYRVATRLVENAYLWSHFKGRLKARLRRGESRKARS